MADIGSRFNANKPRWRNFPLFLVEPLIFVGAAAEKHPNNPTGKYDTYNFLKGMKVDDCLDCAKRHLMKAESPYHSDLDDEFPADKQVYHLAECAWNCLVALHNIRTRPDLDDRFKTQMKAKQTVDNTVDMVDVIKQKKVIQAKKLFSKGDVVKHIDNDVEVTVEGLYYDEQGNPILFVRDDSEKIFGVDPNFYKSIYKE